MHTHSMMGAYALEFLLTSDEGSALELCSPATKAYALEYIYAHSDEGSCPGLVPHAYKMLGLHSQVKLSSRVV